MNFMITCCPCGNLAERAHKGLDGYYYIKCSACGRRTNGYKEPDKAIKEWEQLCEKELESEE